MDRQFTVYDGQEIIEQGQRDVEWNEVRRARDAALAASDWRALKDVTLPNPWKDYRQALRDLPQDYPGDNGNDAADNWPVAPE